MSAPDLDAIQARLDAATPGPWLVAEQAHGEWFGIHSEHLALGTAFDTPEAELISHAPADLAALLAEVKRLTAERDKARAALAALRGDVLGLGHIAKERGSVGVLAIAAVLANHPTTKEARDE